MPTEDTAPVIEALAQLLDITPAHLAAVAARPPDLRREPTLRVLVAEALDGPQRSAILHRHYRRELRLLVNGLPAYVDADGRPVPVRPGFGDGGPSAVTDTGLQDLCDAIDEFSASTTLTAAAKRKGQLPTYTRNAYGRGAAARFRTAVRNLFARAEVRRWTHGDPTLKLTVRRGTVDLAVHLTHAQFEDIREVATSTGRDRVLDGLLVEFLWETGWRREGVLNCTLDGVDVLAGSARTSMKNGKAQQSPVNSQLLAQIRALAVARGARQPWDAVFRGRTGRPITVKHFTNLSQRLKRHKPWAAPLRIGPHAIRRHSLTEVTARHGVSAGLAWANHSRRSGPPLLRYLAEPTWQEKQRIAASVFGPLDAPVPLAPSRAAVFAVPYGGPPTGVDDQPDPRGGGGPLAAAAVAAPQWAVAFPSGPPRSGPPRSEPPRSGPPRSGRVSPAPIPAHPPPARPLSPGPAVLAPLFLAPGDDPP